MSSIPRIVLKPKRARPFFARHPWVYAGSIAQVPPGLEPGAEVAVASHEGLFVARGLYNPASAIRVRLYRWDDAPLDESFWRERLASAIQLRSGTLQLFQPHTACRLIFSEADQLSGLIVDHYAGFLIVQFSSLALFLRRSILVNLLREMIAPRGLIVRTDRSLADQEAFPRDAPELLGETPPQQHSFSENDLVFQVDLLTGQKTGFFLDQRENRLAAARYAQDRRILDLFCYSGAFGLCTLKHGRARHVTGIDSSAHAIELARANALANHLEQVRFEAADVMHALESLRQQKSRFDMIIADPPKFARNAQGLEEAAKAYLRLNLAALSLIESDGILVTCSCSGLVTPDLFHQILAQAAERAGRDLQILESRGQAPDHPVAASCLESAYLKCVIARVTGPTPPPLDVPTNP
jgi:23S rRNA (cytosine1962-C5)-methyltransferase